MKRTLTALIALLTLIIATAAFAQRGPRANGDQRRPGGPPPEGMRRPDGPRGGILPPEAMAKFLGLSDAQKTQAQTLHDTLTATVRPLFEQERANREAVKAAVDAGDSAAAGKAMVEVDKVHDQIKAAHESFKASFAAILTADQKAKFAVLDEIETLRREARRPRE
jgi:Spy/CpxP family protein refolding chaperone